MPRVHHRRARKDYPDQGIQKGDLYYYTKMKTGPRSSRVLRSKTPFKRSQLTNSDYLGELYEIEDDLAALASVDDANDIAERFRNLGQEQQDKLDNMPEGLQEGDTGQMIQERAEACENAADEIETLADSWDHDTARQEVIDEADEEDGELDEGQIEDRIQEKADAILEQIKEITAES